MATTATLEEQYEKPELLRIRRSGDHDEYVRQFLIPHDELETLMPAPGDTHSTDTAQVVVAIGTIPIQGALRGLLPVVYHKPLATGGAL